MDFKCAISERTLDRAITNPGTKGIVILATITGAAGNDVLNGTVGADTINGLAGNDIIDGGAGINTATYAYPLSQQRRGGVACRSMCCSMNFLKERCAA